MSAAGDAAQLERDHLDRQRRTQKAVGPHAELQSIERRLRAAAVADPDPERRRVLLRASDHAAGELVTLAELLATPSPGDRAR